MNEIEEAPFNEKHGVDKVELLRGVGRGLIILSGVAIVLTGFAALSRAPIEVMLIWVLEGLILWFAWMFLDRFCQLCINTVHIRVMLEKQESPLQE